MKSFIKEDKKIMARISNTYTKFIPFFSGKAIFSGTEILRDRRAICSFFYPIWVFFLYTSCP
jgi:hypothetical protein